MSDARLDEVSRTLLEVCRQTRPPRHLPPGSESELVGAARFHRVAPLLHVAYRDEAPHVAELVRADRMRAIAVHLQACAALQQFGDVVGDIPWVTFKGAVFSEHAHPTPGIRSYNDVDVLVDPRDLRVTSRRLLEAGWQVVDYEDMLRNPSVPGEMHWLSPSGVLFDLHWSVINMASRRRLFDVPTADLLHRRVRRPLGPASVWTLAPSDALLHACLHATLAGANKLLHLVDIGMLARSIDDWQPVASRARDWQAHGHVALALGRAQRLLGTPVPAEFTARVTNPRLVRHLEVLVDQLAPVAGGRTNTGPGKFVARAVRSSGPATTAAVGRNAALWLVHRAGGPRQAPAERPVADRASLEVYLQGVEWAAATG